MLQENTVRIFYFDEASRITSDWYGMLPASMNLNANDVFNISTLLRNANLEVFKDKFRCK